MILGLVTSALQLGTLGCIVSFFITVVTNDLADVFLRPRSSGEGVVCVTFGGCSGPGRLIV